MRTILYARVLKRRADRDHEATCRPRMFLDEVVSDERRVRHHRSPRRTRAGQALFDLLARRRAARQVAR